MQTELLAIKVKVQQPPAPYGAKQKTDTLTYAQLTCCNNERATRCDAITGKLRAMKFNRARGGQCESSTKVKLKKNERTLLT